MKTLKKPVSIILAALILCGCFITAFASDGFSYIEADGEIVITGYSGTEKNLVIPGEIDGMIVNVINSNAFKNLDIESVVIPSSIVTIGSYAFKGCSKLTSVEFEEDSSLEIIDMSAFQSCSSLKSIVIPEGVQFVERTVFAGTPLEEITIPSSLNYFYDTSIVTEIGSLTNPDEEHIIINYGGTAQQWSDLVTNSAPYADLSVFRNLLWSVDSEPYVNLYLRPGITITAPDDPVKDYYTFRGWVKQGTTATVDGFGRMPDSDLRYNAKFTPVNYIAAFVADGKEIRKVTFTVETTALNEPAVPEKEGYTGAWENYTLAPRNLTINAVYKVNKYNITFIYGENTVTNQVEYGAPVKTPEVEERVGYDFVWTPPVPATMPAKDLTCTGEYEKQIYQAKLYADGKLVGTIPYYYEQESIQLPEVPAKEGHTGEWLPYSLDVGGTEIFAEYTVNTYTATFVYNGEQTVYNVKFGSAVKAPSVPAKKGYKFVWSPAVPATMPAKNITINGSYVCVSEVKILKNTGSKKIDYGYSLVLYADASDLPDGAKLVWSMGGRDATGNEFSTGALKDGATVTLKLVDKDGKPIKDAKGDEIKDTETVTVNGGFFKILVWFFRNLFKADMTVYQK